MSVFGGQRKVRRDHDLANVLNPMADAVTRAGWITVDPPLIVQNLGDGTHISFDKNIIDSYPRVLTLTGDADDFLLDNTSWLQVNTLSPVNITGIQNGYNGRWLVISNYSLNILRLAHLSYASAYGNRLFSSLGTDVDLQPGGGSAGLIYDDTAKTWLVAWVWPMLYEFPAQILPQVTSTTSGVILTFTNAVEGTFLLTLNGNKTPPIQYSTTPGILAQNLSLAISPLLPGSTVTNIAGSNSFLLAVPGSTAPTVTADSTGISATAQNQIYTVVIREQTGTFALRYGQEQTADMQFGSPADLVQSQLQALPSIGAGNVSVTGGDGGPFAVEFQGDLANQEVLSLTTTDTSGAVTVTLTRFGSNGDPAISIAPFVPSYSWQQMTPATMGTYDPVQPGSFGIGGSWNPLYEDNANPNVSANTILWIRKTTVVASPMTWLLTITGNGGSFALSFNGVSTPPLIWSHSGDANTLPKVNGQAPAPAIQTALANIGLPCLVSFLEEGLLPAVDVLPGIAYALITGTGPFAAPPVTGLSVDGTLLLFTESSVSPGAPGASIEVSYEYRCFFPAGQTPCPADAFFFEAITNVVCNLITGHLDVYKGAIEVAVGGSLCPVVTLTPKTKTETICQDVPCQVCADTPTLDLAVCPTIGLKSNLCFSVNGVRVPLPQLFSAVSVASGGTGYLPGDTFNIIGGNYTVQGTGVVAVIGAGGVVLQAHVQNPGQYSTLPPNPANTTAITGSGSGLSINIAGVDIPNGNWSIPLNGYDQSSAFFGIPQSNYTWQGIMTYNQFPTPTWTMQLTFATGVDWLTAAVSYLATGLTSCAFPITLQRYTTPQDLDFNWPDTITLTGC